MHALHPRVRVAWALSSLVGAVTLGAGAVAVDRFLLSLPGGPALGVAVGLGLALLGVGSALLHYRVWRYDVQDDALYLERGVLTRVESAVPYVRVQHVDTQRGPVERALGLASVVVYTAGSRGADVTVPGLEPDRARALQGRLRELATESEPEDGV
ncbi:PH domain-containing protein [Halomarina ordinaria]|uniref:PH domain-containing protein n=1 Tax=Halomarina ordinaria TaxID=3033939 RepID=A0ABD5U9W8_9EURY|nr:PH domain-containing protein [Halomarina sp. PSRA2]